MKQETYKLGTFDVVMLVISLVIGMGIFRAPATVALRSGDERLFYLAWITGGVFALAGALTFAEVGRRMPVTGAYYRVFALAYHPVIAFAVNIIILASNAASAAGVAIIGAEYISGWIPNVPTSAAATAMIVALYGLNLLGLKVSTQVQNVFIGIKIAMLACIIAALALVDPAPHSTAAAIVQHTQGTWESFGLALIAVSFTYGGYQSTINFGGEIHDSKRTMPLAIMIGVSIITTIYLLANMAYVHVLGFDTLAHSSSIAAMVVHAMFGAKGAAILSGVLVISVFAYINVAMLSNPRVIDAMSQDGVLPRALSSQASPTGTHGALLAFTAISILSVYLGESFEAILNYTIFIDAIGLALGAAAIYRLGKEKIKVRNHIAAAIFIGSCAFTSLNIFMFDTKAALNGVLFFAGIIGVGFIMHRRSRVIH